MDRSKEAIDSLTIQLLARGPIKCKECPLAYITAKRAAGFIIAKNISPNEVYEPYAEVMGECKTGVVVPDYPSRGIKICSHPENSSDIVKASDELADAIFGNLLTVERGIA